MPSHLVFTKPLQSGDLLLFCRLNKLTLKEVRCPQEGEEPGLEGDFLAHLLGQGSGAYVVSSHQSLQGSFSLR